MQDQRRRCFEPIVSAQRLLPVHVLRELAEPYFRSATFNQSQSEPFTTELSFQQWYEDSSNAMWLHDEVVGALQLTSPVFSDAMSLDQMAIQTLLQKRENQRYSWW